MWEVHVVFRGNSWHAGRFLSEKLVPVFLYVNLVKRIWSNGFWERNKTVVGRVACVCVNRGDLWMDCKGKLHTWDTVCTFWLLAIWYVFCLDGLLLTSNCWVSVCQIARVKNLQGWKWYRIFGFVLVVIPTMPLEWDVQLLEERIYG
jgi:hypothetical protein